MSKHTPGPWSINHSNCDIEAEDGGISICYPFDSGTAIGNANARLIAAAPDLLDALKSIVGNRNQDARGTVVLPSQLESAWDIIDKASKC